MALEKVTYEDERTVIKSKNLNAIQDAIIALEKEPKLPSVSVSDNGKVLMVVDGAVSAVTIDNAEGVGF